MHAGKRFLIRAFMGFIPVSKPRLIASGFDKIHEDVFVMGGLVIHSSKNKFYKENDRVRNMLQIANYVYGRK